MEHQDAAIFFGRDAEQELIIANLMASRLTLVFGASGVGKSSLLSAGVAHRMREQAREHLRTAGTPATFVYFEKFFSIASIAGDIEIKAVDDAIHTTEEQTPEDRADLEEDQAMTEKAQRILASPSSSAYARALAALRDDTRAWWEEQLGWNADDYDEDQTPYRADTESLRRFLESEILPWYEKRRREPDQRPLIRAQAFGEAVDPRDLRRPAGILAEIHPDVALRLACRVARDPDPGQVEGLALDQ